MLRVPDAGIVHSIAREVQPVGGLSGYKVALPWARGQQIGRMMAVRAVLTVLLAIAGSASLCSAQSSSLPLVTDLSGKGWTVQNTNGSMILDTSVPGYALEALVNAGKAPNPLER